MFWVLCCWTKCWWELLFTQCYIYISIRQICDWIFMVWKSRHCLRVSSFLIISFISMRRKWSFNPACRTTGVQDTYQTLTAIPFQVEANNSSKVFAMSAYETKFAEFPFLYIFNSLIEWTHKTVLLLQLDIVLHIIQLYLFADGRTWNVCVSV